MNRDLDYVLNYMVKYTKDRFMQDSEPMLNSQDIKLVLNHIYELEQRINKALDYIEGFIEYDEETEIVSTPYSFDGYDLGKIWRILKEVDNKKNNRYIKR